MGGGTPAVLAAKLREGRGKPKREGEEETRVDVVTGGTPAVPAGSGAPAIPDGMEGGTTGGGKGREEEEGDTRCSCRDRVTSRGRGKGEKRQSGGVWTRVEGHPVMLISQHTSRVRVRLG